MESLRPQLALAMLGYCAQRDVSATQLCELAGISYPQLLDHRLDLSEEEMERLWIYAARLSGDQLFGLHFGEQSQLTALGIVGEIVKSSHTVGEALLQASSTISLLTQRVHMQVEPTSKRIDICLKTLPANTAAGETSLRYLQDFLCAFVVHELDGLLFRKVVPVAVTVTHFDNSLQAEYARVFRCLPRRSTGGYSLQLPGNLWDEPLIITRYQQQGHLLQVIASQLAELGGSATYSRKVKQFLMQQAYLGLPSVEDVARNFHITPRTLQRYLKKEGTSFLALQAAARKKIAVELLMQSGKAISEIGYLLGYREPGSFIRAFRRWTGQSPAAFVHSKRKHTNLLAKN